MTNKVVIDEDIFGWSNENEAKIRKLYERIIKVGDDPIELPTGSPDHVVAAYCDKHDCDLFTADVGFYTDCILVDIRTIQITNYDLWETGKRQIFLVKIIEGSKK
jgi:hypothetical protein